jgi:hypothetical protein
MGDYRRFRDGGMLDQSDLNFRGIHSGAASFHHVVKPTVVSKVAEHFLGLRHLRRRSEEGPGKALSADRFLGSSLILRVIVYAPPSFAAKPACRYILAQQRMRAELFAEHLMEIFETFQSHI